MPTRRGLVTDARRRVQEQMCLLLREAMNVGRVAISDHFFSVELEQLEAEVLHAYAAEMSAPVCDAVERDPTSPVLLDGIKPPSDRASLFLQRIVSVQSKQIANLHAQLAARHIALLSYRSPGLPAPGADGKARL